MLTHSHITSRIYMYRSCLRLCPTPPRLRLLFTALGPALPAPLGDAVPEEDEGGEEEEHQDDHRKVPPNTWEKHTKAKAKSCAKSGDLKH